MDGNSAEKKTDNQNVPLEDIDAMARAQGTTRAKVLQNMEHGEQSPQERVDAGQETTNQGGFSQEYDREQFQSNPTGRQDGYRETQGTGYGQSQNTAGQAADDTQGQDGYDPAHSGVRHAQNQPGSRPPAPGRETGTSWGEDQQMGATTDTPDRKNPAG